MPYEPAAPLLVDDPSLQIRLARIHLKTGSLTLARAELETLAGRHQLDTDAHLDLAESRWRTGDLQGAGEAASAYLANGGQAALGFLISAEAAAMSNQHAEARRLVEQAQERQLAELEPVFAGIKRRAMWDSKSWSETPTVAPAKPESVAATAEPEVAESVAAPTEPEAAEAAAAPTEPEAAEAAAAPTEPEAAEAAAAPTEPEVEPAPTEPEVAESVAAPTEPEVEPAPTEVAEAAAAPVEPSAQVPGPAAGATEASTETAAGRSFLEAGDAMMAALHFSIAIRLSLESAGAILEAIGDRQELPLQLVRGDALHALGLEADAGKAYQSVASALAAPTRSSLRRRSTRHRPEPTSRWPNPSLRPKPRPNRRPSLRPNPNPNPSLRPKPRPSLRPGPL